MNTPPRYWCSSRIFCRHSGSIASSSAATTSQARFPAISPSSSVIQLGSLSLSVGYVRLGRAKINRVRNGNLLRDFARVKVASMAVLTGQRYMQERSAAYLRSASVLCHPFGHVRLEFGWSVPGQPCPADPGSKHVYDNSSAGDGNQMCKMTYDHNI